MWYVLALADFGDVIAWSVLDQFKTEQEAETYAQQIYEVNPAARTNGTILVARQPS